jgi:cellobiose phosphorylase
MIAALRAGDADSAWRWFRQTNPASRNEEIEVWETEPYVYPQNVLGDDHPLFGTARNSWLTGTAGWMYRAAAGHLLGIRPDWDGLRIDPRLPPSWEGFSAERRFRGATYRIRVRRGNPGERPGTRIDGKETASGTVPAYGYGDHSVETVV